MTFSPSFECTLDGLRSAVRLRYVVWGVEDPDVQTEGYMRGFAISERDWRDTELIRKRIELIIGDIEAHAAQLVTASSTS